MPVVIVEMYEGRTVDQKRALVRAITDAMVEHADAKPDGLHVIIHDVPKHNWARNGLLGVDREAAPTDDQRPTTNADQRPTTNDQR